MVKKLVKLSAGAHFDRLVLKGVELTKDKFAEVELGDNEVLDASFEVQGGSIPVVALAPPAVLEQPKKRGRKPKKTV